ncbi:phage tail protein [Corallococcus coralloides]|uniref:phage tail protein n=1 Tax=Corallococcus coralloides TaxID=184914 RepID=UPI00030DE6DC|nr:hypothetical protein [Corallococcus coralloides]
MDAPGGAAVKVGGDAEKDPRFRKVIEQLEKGARKTKQHPPAAQKAAEAQAAAVSPPTERLAGAKANQVDAMKSAETPKADPNGFLTLLRAEIEKAMPKSLDDADKFMEGNETGQVKDAVSGGVKGTKDQAAGPTEQATAAPPDPSGVPARQPEALSEEPAALPPPVNGAEAMPAPKPAAQVQALGTGKQDADQQMKDAELTPDQLKKANDPRFSNVLSQKGNVEKVSTAAPGKYIAAEGATLGQAKAKASGDSKAGVAQMAGVKMSGNSKVKARQLLAKQKDEARRKEVTDHIEKLYQQTKQKVDTKLSTLEADVMRVFDLGAEAALADMKTYASREIDRFKDERYSDITGAARWLADLFRPVPEGIKVILGQARARFASKMDALAVRISTMVDTRLADAKAEVDKGQAAIKAYVDSLPKDLQAVGREAQQSMNDRFEELRSGIDSKKNDLAQKLAQKYKEAHGQADAALKKLEEENVGALKTLADAIGEVIKILSEFKDKLMAVLRKGLETIKLILSDPIGFLGNLLAAIKQGFSQFVGNIWTHLKKGFMTWLFGSLAEAGIQVPSDLNVWSILKLVLDVLGLTYAWMRSEAVKLVGERNVALLEKLVEYITGTIKGGPQALWEKLKEDLSNLKEMVIDAIQNWLIETIVKQAVTKILSTFNPAGAIVQAVIAIYNVVMWVIENASRIVALIEAVVNSVHAIATGAIGGAAAWIERALANLIPIVIAFLARLIGLGGISRKIREFITKVQTKVRAAVLGWLKKAWAWVKKLFGEGGGEREDPQKSQKVAAGLAVLDRLTAAKTRAGKIDRSDAERVAAQVKREHPVFKSIRVIEGSATWDYVYVASPAKTKTGASKGGPKRGHHIFNNALKQVIPDLRAELGVLSNPQHAAILSAALTSMQSDFSIGPISLTVNKEGDPGTDANSVAHGAAKQQLLLAFRQFVTALERWQTGEGTPRDRTAPTYQEQSRQACERNASHLRTASQSLRASVIPRWVDSSFDPEAAAELLRQDASKSGQLQAGKAAIQAARGKLVEAIIRFSP